MMLMPAMPGTSWSSSSRSSPNTDAVSTNSRSGSRKLKNAALGLRQNSLRSRRNCSQASAKAFIPSTFLNPIRQLEVDLLERGARDLESLEPLARGPARRA